jgi:hypothetical protein
MALIIVATLMGAFGLFRGIQIVFSGCNEITFDGSARLGARLYSLEWGCLDDGSLTGSAMPGLLTGFGLVVVGILGLTSFLWLSAVLSLRFRRKSRGFPDTPITSIYRDSYKRRLKEFRKQDSRAKGVAGDDAGNQIYLSLLLDIHVEIWIGLSQIKFGFTGRNGRSQEGEIWKCFHGELKEVIEWIMLANAAQIGSRSQQELWGKLCESTSSARLQTPLGSLAKRLGKSGIKSHPYEYLDRGANSSHINT